MASDKVKNISTTNFDQLVVNSNKPVMVDFWAPWCGHCRSVAPVIDELAIEYQDKAIVGKINVDEEGDLAAQFKVMSIPTIIIFKDGEVVDKLIGVRSKAELINMLNKHL